MKLFTLLSGKEVRRSSGKKVVPAQEFSTLVDANALLEQVQEEALAFKKDTVAEAEKTKELAFQEGFQNGLESLNHHLFALDHELKQIRSEIQQKILPLALTAARKIIGEELKLHPDRIVDIVLTSLKPVTQHRKIIIYVNRGDLEQIETHKPQIKQIFEHLESFSIQERDDIQPGGCIIETEAGIINAQLENQWRAMESAFQAFMQQ
ncbi:MAG: HrpE/YscL family type III secretion apparatus protein [Chlamydiia bacterium]|nr:HrpE/YscL family type III secretion apparatus protein [Chlamydiia bacterium]